MDTITITVAENDPDVVVSATLNEEAVTITLVEAQDGATGPTGAGVAAGGVANDILKKTSSTDYATSWETPTSTATANAIVRRDAESAVALGITNVYDLISSGSIYTDTFAGDIYTADVSSSVRSSNFAPYLAGGASLRFSGGAPCLEWGFGGDSLCFPIFANLITFETESYSFSAGASDAFKTALAIASADITDATSAATANAVVRRDASGGAAFVALTGTGDWITTGHFFSNPTGAEAGHFLTKNGTTPTIIAGRSAWFSDSSGAPQFKNGTSSAITLIYSGGPLGTPLTGTLTNCTGLPVTTGVSGLGTNVAAFLATPTSANLRAALTDDTGTGPAVFSTSPTISTPQIADIRNGSNFSAINTNSYTLIGFDGVSSVAWSLYQLRHYSVSVDNDITTLDWDNGQLNDNDSNTSIDWFLRYLTLSSGNVAFDYTGTRNSVSALSFNGINTCLGGITEYYKNLATAGNGQSAIRGVHDSTTNASAKTATTLYAVPLANGGTYRVSFVAKVTRAASTSSVLGGTGAFQAIYTDADDSVVVTTGTITNVSGSTLTGNTTQIVYSGTVTVNAKASSNIQFTFGYTSVGATTMQYNLHVRCEQI